MLSSLRISKARMFSILYGVFHMVIFICTSVSPYKENRSKNLQSQLIDLFFLWKYFLWFFAYFCIIRGWCGFLFICSRLRHEIRQKVYFKMKCYSGACVYFSIQIHGIILSAFMKMPECIKLWWKRDTRSPTYWM